MRACPATTGRLGTNRINNNIDCCVVVYPISLIGGKMQRSSVNPQSLPVICSPPALQDK